MNSILEPSEENDATGPNRVILPDGGRYTETYYAGYNPDTDSYLYHTEANGEYADPFFEEEDAARDFLEKRAETRTKEEYEGHSLHKLRAKKIGEAVEVLTDQAGIGDFIPDGGTHQIDNPVQDEIWFWYDPSADCILQEEVEPYNVRGVFATEKDAHDFITWYTEHHNDSNVDYFELYSAEIELEGHGRGQAVEKEDDQMTGGLPEQADFSNFRMG